MCVIVKDTIVGRRHVLVLLVKVHVLTLKVSWDELVVMTRLPHHTLPPIIQHTGRLLVKNLWLRLPEIEKLFWLLLFPIWHLVGLVLLATERVILVLLLTLGNLGMIVSGMKLLVDLHGCCSWLIHFVEILLLDAKLLLLTILRSARVVLSILNL